MTTERNASAYHRVSDPQFAWGLRVPARRPRAATDDRPFTLDDVRLDVAARRL